MTVPHYGKRNPGSLTAASPGDTLYIPLNFYNDSGASIGIGSTLVAGDIEVFKDGSVTQRATDSGYTIMGDTGNFDNRIGLKLARIQLFNTADDASFYAAGSWYNVAVDSVTTDGRTVRSWVGSFEIGEPRANIVQLGGDTGALNWLKQTFASGFADTGINQRFAQIQSDVDTGLRVHIDDLDTGLHAHISDVDTGIHSVLQTSGVLVSAFSDTGVNNRLSVIAADTDTGIQSSVTATNVTGFADTGVNDRLAKILADTDTGIQSSVTVTTLSDTGSVSRGVWESARTAHTTSGSFGQYVNANVDLLDGDTGAATHMQQAFAASSSVSATVTDLSDTGIVNRLSTIQTKTDKLTFDTGNELQVDIKKVAGVSVTGTGANNDEWRPQ